MTIFELVCPPDAPVSVDVEFQESASPNELQFASIRFLVPKNRCYANTYQNVKFDVEKAIKEAALAKGIRAQYILLKALPHRVEVNSF